MNAHRTGWYLLCCLLLFSLLVPLGCGKKKEPDVWYKEIVKIKDPQEKVKALEDFLAANPPKQYKEGAIRVLITTLYRNLDDPARAIQVGEELLKEETDPDVVLAIKSAMLPAYRKNDPQKFESLAWELIREGAKPEASSYAFYLLQNHYGDNVEKLRELADFLLKSAIKDPFIYNYLAWKLIDGELDPKLGLQVALHAEKNLLTEENMKALNPSATPDRIKKTLKRYSKDFKDTIGWAYFKLGQYRKARRYLEEASALAGGKDAEITMHLGITYLKLGLKKKARESLLNSVLEDPSDKAMEYLAKALGKSKKATEEYVLAKRFERAEPAPDFTLKDLNGKSHTLSSYKGKVVVVNFFSPT